MYGIKAQGCRILELPGIKRCRPDGFHETRKPERMKVIEYARKKPILLKRPEESGP
jgi:hypothetical protein